jgi:Barstar (barnase inhibitor)
MSNLNAFEFVDANLLETSADDFVAIVPAGLTTADDLLRALADVLRFPACFGFNWHGLYDCLTDFQWLEQHTIVLAHQDAPALQASTLEMYLDVLRAAILAWQPRERRRQDRDDDFPVARRLLRRERRRHGPKAAGSRALTVVTRCV